MAFEELPFRGDEKKGDEEGLCEEENADAAGLPFAPPAGGAGDSWGCPTLPRWEALLRVCGSALLGLLECTS